MMESSPLERPVKEPYRILFPLGVLLAWAGVGHWLLLATGVWNEYRSIFHAMAQIQGFMTCFMTGFLYTFIPRRVGGAGPGWLPMASAVVGPIGTTVCAWFERWALSQLFWLTTMGVLLGFALSRLRGRGVVAKLPAVFVWVPASLAMSMVVSVGTGVAAAVDQMWLHDIGRGMLLQGLFAGLVIGVSGSVMPMLLRNQPPRTGQGAKARLGHLALALLYWSTFTVEPWLGTPWAFGLRAGVLGAALAAAGVWRRPAVPGWHRWIAFAAPWFLPLSAAVVALWPEYRRAGLHIGFIGCFAALALAVSIHVVLSHGGRAALVSRRLWQVAAMALSLAIALGARFGVDVDPDHFRRWLGIAAGAFLLGTVAWAELVVPVLLQRSSQGQAESGQPA